MSVLRYLFMFDNARMSVSGIVPATASGVFPTHRYEYEQTQPLRQSTTQLTGASYDYDQLEGAAALKGNGNERVRFLDVGDADDMNADIDAFKAMASYGRGRIWTQTSPGSGLRWAWARLTEMPSLSFTVDNRRHAPVILNFERFSDWYDAEPIGDDGEFSIGSDPETIVVTNPGTAEVRNVVITIKGDDANTSGAAGTTITNTTTGYSIHYSLWQGSSDWVRYDSGRNIVEVSFDSGATWLDALIYGTVELAAGQVGLMLLAPGANSFVCDNCELNDIVFEFSGAWA